MSDGALKQTLMFSSSDFEKKVNKKKFWVLRRLDTREFVATLSGWRNSDGLSCELRVKISRVRLWGNLGLKRRDQLLERRQLYQHIADGALIEAFLWTSTQFLDAASSHAILLIPEGAAAAQILERSQG